ncbi:hypothetical protein [Marinimicrococcus flavescens]|uniref:hypothetical protein n=1 Tax=Marinimicrococcus flavescens TaxID=3031815 RepID=UPI002E191467
MLPLPLTSKGRRGRCARLRLFSFRPLAAVRLDRIFIFFRDPAGVEIRQWPACRALP